MTKIGRNDPCYCGSGKKYKKCCIDRLNTNPYDDFDSFRETLSNNLNSKYKSQKRLFIDYLKKHRSEEILNLLIGIQLIPKNHGKNVRIESIAKEVVKYLNEVGKEPHLNELRKLIHSSFPSHYMEDPPEGLFTEAALFEEGEYTIMPGIVTKGADIFNYFIKSIFMFPNALPKDFIQEVHMGIWITLEFGKRIFDKANLARNLFEENWDEEIIIPESIEDYSFNIEEIYDF